MIILETQVVSAWVDYNGHMNDAEYAKVFSLAVEALMDCIGLDASGREDHGFTIYTMETHLCYRREAHEGQPLNVALTLLDRDAKRLHVFLELFDEAGNVLATSEQMLMGIDSLAERPALFPIAIETAIDTLPKADNNAWPALAGSKIGIRR